jgi:hypothetical protein
MRVHAVRLGPRSINNRLREFLPILALKVEQHQSFCVP